MSDTLTKKELEQILVRDKPGWKVARHSRVKFADEDLETSNDFVPASGFEEEIDKELKAISSGRRED